MSRRRGSKSKHSNQVFTNRKLNSSMRRKLVWSLGVVILALSGLAIRITYINASDGDKYRKQVLTQSQQQYDSRVLPFQRGDILDTNGTILATSEKVYNLVLDCKVVNSDERYVKPTTKALVSVLGMDEDTIKQLLTSEETKSSQYQVLKKEVSIKEKKKFEAYCDVENNKELTEKQITERQRVKGVWFEEEYLRKYPMESLACDVIGFTYSGNAADWGIEGYYSNTLNGIDGRQYGYFNSDADVEQTVIDPVSGSSVVSTIDVNIQKIVEKYIQELWDGLANGPNGKDGAKDIGVVVMNPNTGEILAMGSSDPYDLNNPRDLTPFFDEEDVESMSEEDTLDNLNALWQNFCVSDAFEPGSTVKPMTVGAALDSGAITYQDTYVCDGYQEVADRTIKCNVYPNAHEEQVLSETLKNSCNDAMMQIAERMGVDSFVRYQSDVFNFGSLTGIDLPGESAGITYDDSSMGQAELATSSFGQGFTCTMIQEAAAVSSVINGGNYYRPYVVKQILNSDGGVTKNITPELMKQTLSEEVASAVRQYMGTVVESDGTGKYGKVEGYSMGGKTGTAQKLPRGNGKYLVSFLGFAPLEKPEVLVYAVVDEPNVENQSVSTYAQYLVNQIMREILPYMNIFQDEATDGTTTSFTVEELLDRHGEIKYDEDGDPMDGDSEDSDSEDGDSEDSDSEDGDSEDSDSEDGDSEDSDSEDGDSEDSDSEDSDSEDGDSEGGDILDEEEPLSEGVTDTDVPEPLEDEKEVTGGNKPTDEGFTNEEAGIEE